MNEISQTNIGRASIYEFLFTVYYKVLSSEQLKYIETFAEVIQSIDSLENTKPLIEEIKKIIKIDDLELTLNSGFSKLYGTGTNVKIKERNYLPDASQTDIIMSLSNMFSKYNVVKPDGINHTIDSLSIELLFMNSTAIKAANSDIDNSKAILKDQLEFLDNHLLKWCEKFAESTKENATTKGELFYTYMSEICCQFLKFDRDVIIALLEM